VEPKIPHHGEAVKTYRKPADPVVARAVEQAMRSIKPGQLIGWIAVESIARIAATYAATYAVEAKKEKP